MLRRFFICTVLIASGATQIVAQASQAVPEEQLTVRVTYDDRTAPANLRVELLSAYGGAIGMRTTDGFGSVVFGRLQLAKYKLRISGDGVVTTETSEIDMTASGPNATEYVRVRRVPSTADVPGTLSVTDLKIPSEAKKEFDKGITRPAAATHGLTGTADRDAASVTVGSPFFRGPSPSFR